MKKVNQGFTLIELMIVVAIVGILAAIAIPAYQDYTVRSKISEAMTALAAAKTSISESYISNGGMPTDPNGAGVNTGAQGKIIASMGYDDLNTTESEVWVVLINSELSGANGTAFGMHGSGSATGVIWTCGVGATNGTPDKYLPATCRGNALTNP
jgi:type IV pilus assembly protein PilA